MVHEHTGLVPAPAWCSNASSAASVLAGTLSAGTPTWSSYRLPHFLSCPFLQHVRWRLIQDKACLLVCCSECHFPCAQLPRFGLYVGTPRRASMLQMFSSACAIGETVLYHPWSKEALIEICAPVAWSHELKASPNMPTGHACCVAAGWSS